MVVIVEVANQTINNITMKNAPGILIVTALLFAATGLFAQQSPAFSRPVLRLQDGSLLITYNILNSRPDDTFEIRLEVTDPNGNSVSARSLTGDIGQGVSGGNGKSVRWDLEADRVDGLSGLYVQVVGEKTGSARRSSGTGISRGGAVLRSVAFPGWGLTKINPGSKHWIKGVAGYGFLAGAGAFFQLSELNYQKYSDSYDQAERDQLLNKSNSQGTYAVVMAGAAAAVWVTDLVWTIVASGGLSGNAGVYYQKPFTIGTGFDNVTQAPLLAFRYTF